MKNKSYIVAYTLKHNETPDKFEDRWRLFRAEEYLSTHTAAANFYQSLIANDGDENSKGWYVYIAALTQILDSTDYSQ
jgi:hypothetical protein